MNEARQKQMLAVLLAVLAVVVAWRSVGTLEGRTAFFGGSGPTINVDAALRTRVAELDLDHLERKVVESHAGRNPWNFGPVAAPPVREPQVVVPKRPEPEPQPPRPVEPPQPTEPPKPVPPQIDVQLRGIMGPERLRIAVFDDGEAIINAVEGAVVKNSFRVEKIQIESVLLGYVDFPDVPPVRLPIRGG